MPKLPTSWILPFAVAILLGVGIVAIAPGDSPDSTGSTVTSTGTTATDANSGGDSIVWSHGHDGAARNAEAHWQKHGDEFSEFHSARDYADGAHDFIARPPPGTLTKHRANGDTLYYNPATNTFAVADSQGEPRTMFRPDSGRAYWDRQ